MPRIIRRIVFVFALLAFGLTGTPRFAASPTGGISVKISGTVSAAQRKERKSLFRMLFGRKKAKTKAVKKKTKRRTTRTKKRIKKRTRKTASKKRKRKKSVKRRASAAALAAKAVTPKAEDAKKVLVIGDFFAGGLADGLEKAFAEKATLVVVDRSKANSGFVRDDIVNWPGSLASIVEEVKPSYIVAMLGSNDRQLLRTGGKKLKKRTPEWDAAYTKRIDALGVALKATGIPYSWMGLPPVRFNSMNRDFLVFNEIYGKAAKSPRGEFVDVWDGFSDADGNYTRSGPDVNGQIVLLRPKDGINLTKAGRSRLAFYVQNTITKRLDSALTVGNPDLEFNLGGAQAATPSYDPARTGKTIVIGLNDPKVDGAEILAGEKIELDGGAGATFAVPVLNATTPSTRKEGRVDDYSWPPAPSATGQTPTVSASVSQ